MNEAEALRRLAAQELAAIPRGIADVHGAIAGRVFGALGSPAAPVRLMHDAISRGVYESVSGGLWLGAHAVVRPRTVPLPAIAALNGLYGDRLEAEASPLAIQMQLVGEPETPHVAVFVHGLGETDQVWGYDERFRTELGISPVHVRYNTGRHISQNGASLAALLEGLEAERITLIGHSMGGLVARAACHRGGAWTAKVGHTISLGTPHDGAPLEQAVHTLSAALHLAPETRPFARLLRRRSAGIRDLRRGSLVDEDWHGRDPDALRARASREVPLLPTATHCFIAATITRSAKHPLGRLLGDTLVLSPSASGSKAGYAREHGLELGGTHHLALLDHPAVYEQLHAWLA